MHRCAHRSTPRLSRPALLIRAQFFRHVIQSDRINNRLSSDPECRVQSLTHLDLERARQSECRHSKADAAGRLPPSAPPVSASPSQTATSKQARYASYAISPTRRHLSMPAEPEGFPRSRPARGRFKPICHAIAKYPPKAIPGSQPAIQTAPSNCSKRPPDRGITKRWLWRQHLSAPKPTRRSIRFTDPTTPQAEDTWCPPYWSGSNRARCHVPTRETFNLAVNTEIP